MALCLLLLVAIHVAIANGFGFQITPFQMEVQTQGAAPFSSPFAQSAFPSMNMMSFPPIFNPLEAMGREIGAMDPETRGMDVEGSVGNVTTNNKTDHKDGFKITTISSDGPGFHSYIKEYEKEGNDTKNSTAPAGPPPDIGKLLSAGKIFDIMNQLRNMGKKPQKCKKCGAGKFCDPIFHLCRKKFAEGRTCMAQKQCGKSLRCQWGKCQKAKKGDPGTFCKGNSQCSGDSCCRNTPGSFHLMCIPQQAEGAICGLHERQESVAKLFYVVKRSSIPTCTPCKSGLKCAETGDAKYKRCVKVAYVAKVDQGSGEEEEDEDEEDENDRLPSDAVLDDTLDRPKSKPHQSQNLKKPIGSSQSGQLITDQNAEKHIKSVFEAKVKPVKPETSSAKPPVPKPPKKPTNPVDPSGGNKDVNGEDGKESKENDEYSNENKKEEEEEADEGSTEDDEDLSSDKPIPIKTQIKATTKEKEKTIKGKSK